MLVFILRVLVLGLQVLVLIVLGVLLFFIVVLIIVLFLYYSSTNFKRYTHAGALRCMAGPLRQSSTHLGLSFDSSSPSHHARQACCGVTPAILVFVQASRPCWPRGEGEPARGLGDHP